MTARTNRLAGAGALPPKLLGAVVINLARSPDRLATLLDRFRAYDIVPERFEAIDARAEPERCAAAVSPLWFRLFAGRDWLPGEIGCALSHMAVWASFDRRTDEALLVLEDDAVPDAAIADLADAVAALPPNWDVLVLAENYSRMPWWKSRGGPIGLVRYFHPGYLAVGYVVNRRILRKRHLWERPRPVRFPFDHWRVWSGWHGLAVYATERTVVHPPADGRPDTPLSTIGRADSVPRHRGLRGLPKRLFRVPLALVATGRLVASVIRLARAGRLSG